jgi:hypothetical protein
MGTCSECRRPCPEHNVTGCATCHNHPGECAWGGCFEKATTSVEFKGGEVRAMCGKHAAHPANMGVVG